MPGPDATVPPPQRRAHGVPERPVVPQQHRPRRLNQFLVGDGQRGAATGKRGQLQDQSAASASSSLGGASMVFATTPDWSRTFTSMAAAMSG